MYTYIHTYIHTSGAKLTDTLCTKWFKYDRDDLCVNKSQFVPVIFEPPFISKGVIQGG